MLLYDDPTSFRLQFYARVLVAAVDVLFEATDLTVNGM
jgi:hypothetical protein